MSTNDAGALTPADEWGVVDGYHRAAGGWTPTADATRQLLHRAMGATPVGPPPPWQTPMWFVRPGFHEPLHGTCRILLEDGTDLGEVDALPSDLPHGYHELEPVDGGPTTQLVVTPGRCTLPVRQWGLSAQLYALRSARSWGIGDLGDLDALAGWSAGLGAGALLLNPLHADTPTVPQEPSPYYASSRRFRNLLSIAVEDAPGAAALGVALGPAVAAGRALNATATIDRDAAVRLKVASLGQAFEAWSTDAGAESKAGFDGWRAAQGADLDRFATYSALAELYGPRWPAWPVGLRRPDGAQVAAVVAQIGERVMFHAWCQWVLEGQLARASGHGVGLIGDLAVGFRPDGFDAWCDQDLLALDCRVGAPPDGFNPSGQDWGLPPYVPWRLRAARYRPFVEAIRANLAHLSGLRIDHVMGLFRLYWIPPGEPADAGAYVRYPHSDLLDLLALEAARAGAYVIGEDLGTVEPFVGAELRERHLMGCRVVWFEKDPPSTWPVEALGTITTHDLPTVAGVWTGADAELRRATGVAEDPEALPWFRSRIERATGLDSAAPVGAVLVGLHLALAASPALVRLATLDDLCAAVEPPNVPGTIDERPNWRIPLPLTMEQLAVDPVAAAVSQALAG